MYCIVLYCIDVSYVCMYVCMYLFIYFYCYVFKYSLICQVDVFTLGRTYLKLSQELYINLPAVGKMQDYSKFFVFERSVVR